jgi:hypothetical protein
MTTRKQRSGSEDRATPSESPATPGESRARSAKRGLRAGERNGTSSRSGGRQDTLAATFPLDYRFSVL